MSKQDRQGVRSPTDLERKYDLAAIAGLKKAARNSVEGLNKINETLEQFMVATLGSFENLQSQIDGSITTHFYSGVPTLENVPAKEWTTSEDKNNHLGDLYYDKDSGYAYRFSLDNENYVWIKLTDSDVAEALAIANSAKDTADGKRRVFTEQPAPPYDQGDLWFKEQEIFICQFPKLVNEEYQEGDFVTATKYTDDSIANQIRDDFERFMGDVEANYSTTVEMESAITKSEERITTSVNKTITEKVDVLQQQIDGAIETYTGSSEPTLENAPANEWSTDEVKDTHIGDLYIVNSDGGDLAGFYYRFEKKETADDSGRMFTFQWVLLKDNEVTKALQDAKEANERAEEIAKNLEENYSNTVQMQSEIKQAADEINIEVSKKVNEDKVVAAINLSSEQIELKGKRLLIEAENLTINPDGTLSAKNGKFIGVVESSEGNIGPWKLGDIGIYNDTAKMGFLCNGAGLCAGVWYAGFTYEEMQEFAESGTDLYPPVLITKDGSAIFNSLTVGDFQTGQPTSAYIMGDVEASGSMYATSFIPWSQAKKKKNFELLQSGLNILKDIDIYKYNYKTEADGIKKHVGFVIGEDYKYSEIVTDKNNMGADIYSLVSVCVKAIQELSVELQELKSSKNE